MPSMEGTHVCALLTSRARVVLCLLLLSPKATAKNAPTSNANVTFSAPVLIGEATSCCDGNATGFVHSSALLPLAPSTVVSIRC